MGENMKELTPRRWFLSRFGMTASALGLGAATVHGQSQPAPTAPTSPAEGRWHPAREAKDDWYDQLPGVHRIFFDTLSASGLGEAQAFAGNTFEGNKNVYGLENNEIAIVICIRHMATPLAFGDAIWTKYGSVLGDAIKLTDAKTGQPPTVNSHKATLEALAKRGVHFAVCDMASHRFAGMVARRTDGNADAIYKEMVENAVSNAHFVAAGIIAVNRAQERGYSVAYVG
ncbi:MAG TPA: DsrE family protein [Vicinamibacterales bacterium]